MSDNKDEQPLIEVLINFLREVKDNESKPE